MEVTWILRSAFAAAIGVFMLLALTDAPGAADGVRDDLLRRVPGVEALDAQFGPDKVTHFGAFAFLALALVAADLRIAGRVWPSAILLFAFGVAIEYLQSRSGARQAEALDVAANAAGMAAGLFIGAVFTAAAAFGRRLQSA